MKKLYGTCPLEHWGEAPPEANLKVHSLRCGVCHQGMDPHLKDPSVLGWDPAMEVWVELVLLPVAPTT
jgi:hypothetical protein